MTSVQLDQISKSFGFTVALDNIEIQVAPGELLFLLGPSGCGKTTLLRIVAGLLAPSSGRIFFNEQDVTRLGTEQRNAVLCFQNYALWPHMTVRENVAFGLRNRAPAVQQQRVAEVLRLVQLGRFAERKPNALSGGQQQRAALARALAVEPRCLLLDEPLSNLDAKLRLEMRGEIRRICKNAGLTTLYVTHDQKEALSIADRIVLLKDGRAAQIGTPAELYFKPNSSFVADFIGQTNLVQGTIVDRTPGAIQVQTPLGKITAAFDDARDLPTVLLSIRPEHIRIVGPHSPPRPSASRLRGKLIETVFIGESCEYTVELNGQRVRAAASPPMLNLPSEILIEIDPETAVVLPK
jgi:iron(III) transport system ATP-binding protein